MMMGMMERMYGRNRSSAGFIDNLVLAIDAL